MSSVTIICLENKQTNTGHSSKRRPWCHQPGFCTDIHTQCVFVICPLPFGHFCQSLGFWPPAALLHSQHPKQSSPVLLSTRCFHVWFMSSDSTAEWVGKALVNCGEEEAAACGKLVPCLQKKKFLFFLSKSSLASDHKSMWCWWKWMMPH